MTRGTRDDNGLWYRCKCGQEWQAPGHPEPKKCPECDRDGEEFEPND